MQLINRGVVIIKARQPFVDWINSTTPEEPPLTLAEVNRECTAVLVPDLGNEIETNEYLEPLKPKLLEMQLAGWYTDEQTWPRNRTARLFDAWFRLEVHSMVWDGAGTEIIYEEL
jgi:hypothetical protein